MIGVPTAPKTVATAWPISAATTAASAGKPSASSRGATTAAGVPNPATPSMNVARKKPSRITCTRRSSLIVANPALIRSTAPERISVYSNTSAPKTIHSISMADITPLKLAAATYDAGISQTVKAITAAAAHATGMTRTAGHNSPTSRTATIRSGTNASSVSTIGLSRGPSTNAAHDCSSGFGSFYFPDINHPE